MITKKSRELAGRKGVCMGSKHFCVFLTAQVRYTPTDTAGMAPQLLDAQYRVNCDVSGVSQNRTAGECICVAIFMIALAIGGNRLIDNGLWSVEVVNNALCSV